MRPRSATSIFGRTRGSAGVDYCSRRAPTGVRARSAPGSVETLDVDGDTPRSVSSAAILATISHRPARAASIDASASAVSTTSRSSIRDPSSAGARPGPVSRSSISPTKGPTRAKSSFSLPGGRDSNPPSCVGEPFMPYAVFATNDAKEKPIWAGRCAFSLSWTTWPSCSHSNDIVVTRGSTPTRQSARRHWARSADRGDRKTRPS
jgi:hypothetical protein